MADMVKKVMKFGVASIPLIIGLILFGNTQIIGFLPVIVHQILGIVLIVAGIFALKR